MNKYLNIIQTKGIKMTEKISISAEKTSTGVKVEVSAGPIDIGMLMAKIVSTLPNQFIPLTLISFTKAFELSNPHSNIKMCAGNNKDVLKFLEKNESINNEQTKLN